MKQVSLMAKPVIISLLFCALASPAFAISSEGIQNRQNKPSVTVMAKGKTQSCMAKEASTKKRMTQLSQLVVNMESVFDSIADRVKSFYTNKVLPTGKTVSNYDALINDIAAKKALVTTALDKAKTDISAFNCTTGDPKVLMNTFRLDMQSVKTALKNYRTSIKNLIVAVSRVAGEGLEVEEVTPTLTPTITNSI